jgi:hypothetical protein
MPASLNPLLESLLTNNSTSTQSADSKEEQVEFSLIVAPGNSDLNLEMQQVDQAIVRIDELIKTLNVKPCAFTLLLLLIGVATGLGFSINRLLTMRQADLATFSDTYLDESNGTSCADKYSFCDYSVSTATICKSLQQTNCQHLTANGLIVALVGLLTLGILSCCICTANEMRPKHSNPKFIVLLQSHTLPTTTKEKASKLKPILEKYAISKELNLTQIRKALVSTKQLLKQEFDTQFEIKNVNDVTSNVNHLSI